MSRISRAMLCFAAIVVIAVATRGQDRKPPVVGDETGRDAVGFRKDAVTKETVGDRRAPANTPTTKQAIEDFMQIQKSNRQIQDIAQQTPLALDGIATAAREVGIRAKRLKTSLSLPSPPKESAKKEMAMSASTDELLSQIKELDTNIKAFVTNPIFRKISDSTRDLPLEASISLSRVIALSKVLEDSARKLR